MRVMRVYEAKIRKENIYAYLADGDTVFLNPDKLFNMLYHKDFPLDDIDSILCPSVWLIKKYEIFFSLFRYFSAE